MQIQICKLYLDGYNVVRNSDDMYIGKGEYSSTGSGNYHNGYFTNSGYHYLIRGTRKDTDQIVNNYTKMNSSSDSRDNGGESIIDYSLSTHPEDIKLKVNDIEITDTDAKEYYLKAYFFSKWVNRELGAKSNIKNSGAPKNGITLDTIKNVYDNSGDQSWRKAQILVNNQGIEDYKTKESLFDLESGTNDPTKEDSLFVNHKRQVIQNSIQYNLNSAISTYSENYAGTTDFSMPVFNASDWDKVLGKISMAVFMQGLPCGTNTWGDYAIATSTNNKLYVNENNLLFTKNKDAKNDKISSYHKIDCKKLSEEVDPTKDVYAAMSYEYSYDAKEESALVYAYKNGSEYCKYYKFKTEWYDWNGVKVDNTTLKSTLQANAKILSSAYIKFRDEEYAVKTYFFIDSGGYNFFQYSNINKDTGALTKIDNDMAIGFDPMEHEGDIYVNSYIPQVSESINLYDHANVDCYWCMMGANYEIYDFEEILNTSSSSTEKLVAEKIAKAWYTYIAKYRNNQFKMTDSIHR